VGAAVPVALLLPASVSPAFASIPSFAIAVTLGRLARWRDS
jgi:hypothetical protein